MTSFQDVMGKKIKKKSTADGDNDVDDSPSKKKVKVDIPLVTDVGQHSLSRPLNGSSDESILKHFAQVRDSIKTRRCDSMTRPKLFFDKNYRATTPLYLVDLQKLILYALLGGMAPFKPNWACLLRHQKVSQINVLILHGLSEKDVRPGIVEAAERKPSGCPIETSDRTSNQTTDSRSLGSILRQSLDMKVDFVSPASYGEDVYFELFMVPLTARQISQLEANEVKFDQLSASAKAFAGDDQLLSNDQKAPTSTKTPAQEVDSAEENLSRRSLILNAEQLLSEGYPLPGFVDTCDENFVFTKSQYEPVSDSSPLFALDCEMCYTVRNRHEVTRVTLVDEKRTVLIDNLVKPPYPIKDYLTRFSGITADMLENVTTTLPDVQKTLSSLLPADAILAGQSLDNDFRALEIFHPYVIDTSLVLNLSGSRARKSSLKNLTDYFLDRSIQKHSHCSTEDALACLDLVLMKLKEEVGFGDRVATELGLPEGSRQMPDPKKRVLLSKRQKREMEVMKRKQALKRQRFRSILTWAKRIGRTTLIDSQQSIDDWRQAGIFDNVDDACYQLVGVDTNKAVARQLCTEAAVRYSHKRSKVIGAAFHCEDDSRPNKRERLVRHVGRFLKNMADRSMVLVICPGDEQNSVGCAFVGCVNRSALTNGSLTAENG